MRWATIGRQRRGQSRSDPRTRPPASRSGPRGCPPAPARGAVEMHGKRLSDAEAAEDDILASYAFPADHRRKIRSTNPLERFNREIGRRTDVVGIFPDDASLIRLASIIAIEANDEGLVQPQLHEPAQR